MKKLGLILLTMCLMVAPSLAQYTFSTVDFPGATNTNLYAVNDLGQYVGASFDASWNPQAIYFDGKSLGVLDPGGVVGTSPSYAFSLNNFGDIAGGYYDAAGHSHGYLYNAGSVTTIDYPGAVGTLAYGVNDRREVIGVYADTAGSQHAFLLRKGVYKNIDLTGGVQTVPLSINDWTQIVGEYITVTGTAGQGYLQRKNGKFTTYDAPGAPANSTYFISINNPDQILGTWVDANNLNHNFLLTGGRYRAFNLPKSLHATQASAQTINDFDEIVGWFADAQSVQHGFVALPKDRAR
jgi:probable HAF family extracellular repeat protein